jgi:ATP-dependent RNA helicase MSS116, mitochondrial
MTGEFLSSPFSLSLPADFLRSLVQAKTGTGKTIAFLIPTLHFMLSSNPVPRGQVDALVLSPTRELALQIAKECDQLTSCLPKPIECHTAFGGTARAANLKKFLNGSPSILVATPGRLKDYLTEDSVRTKFANIRTVILDEADTMLEKGFLEDVRHILKLLPPKSSGWQGMCFSATIPDKIKDVIHAVLNPGYSRISTVDQSEPPTHTRVPQYHVIIPSITDTLPSLLSLIRYEQEHSPKNSKIIVFGTTARVVGLYAEMFRDKSASASRVYELHSRLNQPQRTRTTEDFKKAASGIMFATDVIGRGMDFPDVTCVVQVGLPMNGEQYVHRVGRTARAEKDGRAVILLTQAESFFLATNPQLPIQPYEHTANIVQDKEASQTVSQIMTRMDEGIKQKAYAAYLGFMKTFMNKLKLKPEGLVALANEFAVQGMGCAEPPAMDRRTVGKMGLKGVRGLRIAPMLPATPVSAPRTHAPAPATRAPAPASRAHARAPTTPATSGGGNRTRKRPVDSANEDRRPERQPNARSWGGGLARNRNGANFE